MIIEKRIPELEYYNPVKIVNEFATTIKRELDLLRIKKIFVQRGLRGNVKSFL